MVTKVGGGWVVRMEGVSELAGAYGGRVDFGGMLEGSVRWGAG